MYNYVKRKERIRTILGFCCANLGSERWRNNPRIVHANTGSEDLLRKPRIHTQSSRIAQPNLGHPRQQPTIDRASEAARPSAETKPQPIARAKQFDLLRQRSHKRSHTQSSSPILGNEARSIAQSRTHTGSTGNDGNN